MYLSFVIVLCLRVNDMKREWGIDLPELTSIRLGYCTFSFCGGESTELIMRSDHTPVKWWLDLPKLTTLTTEGEDSESFRCPHHIILESASSIPSSLLDMPSLATVTLPHAFEDKNDVRIIGCHTSSFPSFVAIGSLEEYDFPPDSYHKHASCCIVYCISFFKQTL